ncbi:hypothetical protein [Skermania sp. ID1734]|uniref:hypothetical protein n=1 Tax=Skermania sp. ID1734 TaxID=2597516 RepID=UPI00163D7E71|nr:hypothetical protein [Skermania sp. ID1734]
MVFSRSDFRVIGNARNGFRVSQRVGGGWESHADRYATAAEAREAIERIISREAER